MTRRLRHAEEGVVRARAELRDDVDDLVEWLDDTAPYARLLSRVLRLRRNMRGRDREPLDEEAAAPQDREAPPSFIRRAVATIISNPLPVFMVAFGTGWLLQETGNRSRSRSRERETTRDCRHDMKGERYAR